MVGSRITDTRFKVLRVSDSDMLCPGCGHYRDTPNHEYGCGPEDSYKKYSPTPPRKPPKQSRSGGFWDAVAEFIDDMLS